MKDLISSLDEIKACARRASCKDHQRGPTLRDASRPHRVPRSRKNNGIEPVPLARETLSLGPFDTALVNSPPTHHLSLQMFVKRLISGYSDIQVKVLQATSNDSRSPSGTQMDEIAQMTYNQFVPLLH